MKLYMFPVAPNPTRVRLYLAEKRAGGAQLEIEEIPVSLVEGEQRTSEHLARNPFGKLPVLEMDSGETLFESLSIIDYLEELHPSPPLFGTTPLERARARQLERIVDLGVLLPIARIVHATRSPLGLPPNPAVADFHRKILPRQLAHLEGSMDDGRTFLGGDRVTVADCTLAAALQFGRFRELEFLSEYPALRAWDGRYRKRSEIEGILVV